MAKRIRVAQGETNAAVVPGVASVPGAIVNGAAAADASAATAVNGARARPSPASVAKGKASAAAAGGAETKHVMLPAFLSKTFEIFSMPEFANICGWNASGDTIIVSQLEAFVAMVLPRFFKHRNFPSFVRQLNLYGFHKTVLDSKRLEFQHPYFKRDRPDLLHHIKRKVSSSSNHNSQALVNSSIQNSRLDAHREISDTLLREMKELRHRSDAMEKRLRELEIDNAIVRSDNLKLWKHLEAAKDKQIIMQEKMKKIMWILYQIYRGKHPAVPKLSGNDSSTVIGDDLLGPKEFREVLRFLAMDEPPMLPDSTSADVTAPSQASRKRKFVEVPVDGVDVETLEGTGSSRKLEPASVVEVASSMPANSLAMTIPTNPVPMVPTGEHRNNVLSLFSPLNVSPRSSSNGLSEAPASAGLALTNGFDSVANKPAAPPAFAPEVVTAAPAIDSPSNGMAAASPQQLGLIDEDLPLLSDSEGYTFGDGEEHVMKKLEDFETSLLDEYDVSCLDTLLQQLKSSAGDKAAALPAVDPEEIFVGPDEATTHTS